MLAVHRTDERDVIRDAAEARQQIRNFHAALAVPAEAVRGWHQRSDLVGEFELVGDIARSRGPGMFLQFRLVVEEVDLARPNGINLSP